MTEPTSTPSRPGWRHLRISLRWLMLLVLAAGCGMWWIVREARIQREAVAAIRDAGGGVWYDWQWDDGNPAAAPPGLGRLGGVWYDKQWDDGNTRYDGSPIWPKWLIDRMGIDFFGHVVAVIMYDPASDEVLVPIGRLGRLEYLDLSPPRGFAGRTRLRPPRPGEPAVTDAGLVHLEGLRHLEHVCLTATAITDAGLVHLKPLTRLKRLILSETAIHGAGLVHLKAMSRLETLNLNRSLIDDAAMVHLESLTNLRYLNLGNTPHINGDGLGHLKGLTKLKDLEINGGTPFKSIGQQLRQALPRAKVAIGYCTSD